MAERPFHVLFLCTGNSARSILGESLLSRLGGDRFRASSAGSRPTGAVHPGALALLSRAGHDVSGLASKSWDEATAPGSAPVDLVITVCDAAAAETCPVWPGHPLQLHWGLPDPAAVAPGPDQERAFARVYATLETRIRALVALEPARADPALPGRLAALTALAP